MFQTLASCFNFNGSYKLTNVKKYNCFFQLLQPGINVFGNLAILGIKNVILSRLGKRQNIKYLWALDVQEIIYFLINRLLVNF